MTNKSKKTWNQELPAGSGLKRRGVRKANADLVPSSASPRVSVPLNEQADAAATGQDPCLLTRINHRRKLKKWKKRYLFGKNVHIQYLEN